MTLYSIFVEIPPNIINNNNKIKDLAERKYNEIDNDTNNPESSQLVVPGFVIKIVFSKHPKANDNIEDNHVDREPEILDKLMKRPEHKRKDKPSNGWQYNENKQFGTEQKLPKNINHNNCKIYNVENVNEFAIPEILHRLLEQICLYKQFTKYNRIHKQSHTHNR